MMNEHFPAVSVILPVYNGERFLRAAIESVLNQEQVRVELIVVDGDSTDGTGAISASFEDRLRYFRTVRDNVSIAKNFGIPKARHPLIAFMSSDDFWLPLKLQKQIAWMTSNPGVDMVVCQMRYFLHEGFAWPENFPRRLQDQEPVGLLPEGLLCRKEVFDRVGVFDPTLTTAEDVDWFARARERGEKIGVAPEVLLLKGVHDRNTSLTSPDIRSDLFRALRGSVRRKKTEEAR
jgi:glycosyltransferase involved in cell wall biosynthesis